MTTSFPYLRAVFSPPKNSITIAHESSKTTSTRYHARNCSPLFTPDEVVFVDFPLPPLQKRVILPGTICLLGYGHPTRKSSKQQISRSLGAITSSISTNFGTRVCGFSKNTFSRLAEGVPQAAILCCLMKSTDTHVHIPN